MPIILGESLCSKTDKKTLSNETVARIFFILTFFQDASKMAGLAAMCVVFLSLANLLHSTNSVALHAASRIIPRCSVEWCSAVGAPDSCHILSEPFNKITSCGEWGQTYEGQSQCKALGCPRNCLPEEERPIDNNGVKYCNKCDLMSASCASGYELYFHPSTFLPTPRPTPVVRSELKSTERILPLCSLETCSTFGAGQICVRPSLPLIFCDEFALTEESREQCDMYEVCIAACDLPEEQILGSDGIKYCNKCYFRRASCTSLYWIYGPVDMPESPTSSPLD